MDIGYPDFGYYLNATGRPMLYSCSWPVYQTYSGMTVSLFCFVNFETFLQKSYGAELFMNLHQNLEIGTGRKGSFTNYVDKILAFFDHLPTSIDIFYGLNIDKKWTFSDHLPT
jgi:hypothetical protein